MKTCHECEGVMKPVSEERSVAVGRRRAVVRDEFLRCDGCGEESWLPGQMNATMRRASEAIRRELGLLTPEAIRAVRESLGLSQRAFEDLLGVGPKTVVRWEKGTVFQNAATDALIRLVRDVDGVAQALSHWHGVPLGEAGSTSSQPAIPMTPR